MAEHPHNLMKSVGSSWTSTEAEKFARDALQRATDAEMFRLKNLSLLEGAAAFERLLTLATKSDAGQARVAAEFIGAVSQRHGLFDIYELRGLDKNISDDILTCMDTIAWGRFDLQDLVRGGLGRSEAVCQAWGIKAVKVCKESS